MLPALGLVAVLVLVTQPLVAFLATLRTGLARGEREFTGWMAPRGIVAPATASTFSAQLAARHVGGASIGAGWIGFGRASGSLDQCQVVRMSKACRVVSVACPGSLLLAATDGPEE